MDLACSIFEPEVRPGQNLLARGREMRAGEVVVARRSILATGAVRVSWPRSGGPRSGSCRDRQVAIVPTGDELVEPGQMPGPGQIRNSNAMMLEALANQRGGRASSAADCARRAGAAAPNSRARARCGYSGHHGGCLGRPARSGSGGARCTWGQCIFHKLRLKPGKPLWFGVGPPRGDGPRRHSCLGCRAIP